MPSLCIINLVNHIILFAIFAQYTLKNQPTMILCQILYNIVRV